VPGSPDTTEPGGISGGGGTGGTGGISGGGTALARSGSDTSGAVTAGLALVAVGAGFVLAARRRRQLVLARVNR
jgi:LPXTG-motif cell wall-anchored protein